MHDVVDATLFLGGFLGLWLFEKWVTAFSESRGSLESPFWLHGVRAVAFGP
jgi:hypothetical protein